MKIKLFIKKNIDTILTYSFLLIGAIFCCLSRYSNNIFFSVFIYPTCFLLFLRRTKAWIGLPLVFLSILIKLLTGLSGSITSGGLNYIVEFSVGICVALIYLIPFMVDKIITQRLFNTNKWLSPLIFTLTWVTIDVIISVEPFGNFLTISYSLCQILNMCGILSLFGLHFLTFIIIYFDASIADFIENKKVKKLIPCLVVLCFSSLYSGIYVIYPTSTIQKRAKVMMSFAPENYFSTLEETKNSLLSSVTRANSEQIKANILAMPEKSFSINENQREEFKQFCQNSCSFENLCVVVGMNVLQDDGFHFKNEAWIFGKGLKDKPNESYLYIYQKVHSVPFDEANMISGDGTIPLIDTLFGKISTVVCLDLEFENYVSKVGRLGTDILIAPSWDWKGVPTNHSIGNAFRAIENGVNFIKPTKNGYSVITDYKGNIYGQYYSEDSKYQIDHIYDICTNGVFTLYPYLALFINYFYPIVLISIIGYNTYQYKKSNKFKIYKNKK